MSFKSGFTLVELLVTIAVVGILAAISVSLFSEYRAKALNAMAKSAMLELRFAAETVCGDFEEGTGQVPTQECFFGVNNFLEVGCDGSDSPIRFISEKTRNSEDVSSYMFFTGWSDSVRQCKYTVLAIPCEGDEAYSFTSDPREDVSVGHDPDTWNLYCGNLSG